MANPISPTLTLNNKTMDNQTKELYQWVNASERLPDKKMIGEWFNIKLRGYPAGAGKFIKTVGDGILTFDIDKYGKGESETFHHIEWLESIPYRAHTEVTDTRVWEYFSEQRTPNEQSNGGEIKYLNKMGSEGWELCNVDEKYIKFYWKRMLIAQSHTDTPKGYTEAQMWEAYKQISNAGGEFSGKVIKQNFYKFINSLKQI